MADIFISYNDTDKDRVAPIVSALEANGWSTFWDWKSIPVAKNWRQFIQKGLEEAKCVLVLWSEKSIDSKWVIEEADHGQSKGILIPILINDVRPPIGFRHIQAANLINWTGDIKSFEFKKLLHAIELILDSSPRQFREQDLLAEEERKLKREEKRRKVEEELQRHKIIAEERQRLEEERQQVIKERKAEEERQRKEAEGKAGREKIGQAKRKEEARKATDRILIATEAVKDETKQADAKPFDQKFNLLQPPKNSLTTKLWVLIASVVAIVVVAVLLSQKSQENEFKPIKTDKTESDVLKTGVQGKDVEKDRKKRSNELILSPLLTSSFQIFGLNLSPNQNPTLMTSANAVTRFEQNERRLKIVAPYTRWVRTYGVSGGMEDVPHIAHNLKLKAAIGAWLSKNKAYNEKEFEILIYEAKRGNVDLAIIGNEVLLHNYLKSAELISYMRRFRAQAPNVPVTTAEVDTELIKRPEIISECDIIMANFHPYWEGVNVNDAIPWLETRYKRLKDLAKGKEVIISETGWPSAGESVGAAVASPENSVLFFNNFLDWAHTWGITYFYFEAYDAPWKASYEGVRGAHWGLWNQNEELKPGMQTMLSSGLKR
jgi:exo-beta-1,3-glucanase (GH17 family)